MLSVYRTLSVRYLRRRWVRAALIVACIVLGVAMLVFTRSLNETMNRAGQATVNPMPGVADLVVSNGELTIPADLAKTLSHIPGVQQAWPRIFENVRLPDLKNRTVLLMGIDKQEAQNNDELDIAIKLNPDVQKALETLKRYLTTDLGKHIDAGTGAFLLQNLQPLVDKETQRALADYLKNPASKNADKALVDLMSRFIVPVLVGEELDRALQTPAQDEGFFKMVRFVLPLFPRDLKEAVEVLLPRRVMVQRNAQSPRIEVIRVGTVSAKGIASALAGNTLTMDLADAGRVLGLEKGKVNRIDVTLKPGPGKSRSRDEVMAVAQGHGEVRTPEEQGQAIGNVMSGMQTGFALCGLAALVVGLFLVYSVLSVSVAERRHEIGVLLSLGATRQQIRMLFAGEAALLGLTGSLLGIPLGIGLAYLLLQPMQQILSEIFFNIEARQVAVGFGLIALALVAGITTAVAAALVPAVIASRDIPAEAVRRVAKLPTWRFRAAQVLASGIMLIAGATFILLRGEMAPRVGTYGGMILVLLAALVAAPLLAAVVARAVRPLAQRFWAIEWRLAADNLVRAPGRTGLVIAALAAGVALVTQTYGTIVSNRGALRDWVQEAIAADLIVTAGSPVGAGGGQTEKMNERLGDQLRSIVGVESALPMRFAKVPYRDTTVLLFAIDAPETYRIEAQRQAEPKAIDLYKTMAETPRTAMVSKNFAALHHVAKGDSLLLNSPRGGIRFLVVGTIEDYSWNHGTIFINRADYQEHWADREVNAFDVFVADGHDVLAVRETLLKKLGAENSLVVQTRTELQERIDGIIERLYGLALVQQFGVMIVAALGVVAALLISVLQRRREMGLLRAIGASRAQVVRSILAEACLMGAIGTGIGFLVGIPLEWYVLKVLILEESGYLFPVYIPWKEGLIIIVAGLLTPILAGLGPALISVRQGIPESVAYE
ncbi:MAG: FtsX-like permease family protein [Planctomycetes bacterium]|nr:FtsX-like permease family protein [Planctomycetota bacterium]